MVADKTVCILNLSMAWNSAVFICWFFFLIYISLYKKLLVAFTGMVQFSVFLTPGFLFFFSLKLGSTVWKTRKHINRNRVTAASVCEI